MSRDQNLTVQQKLGDVLANRELDRLDDVFAADVIDHDPAPDQGPGAEGLKQFWSTFLTAFPDLELTPEALSADEDYVSVALAVSGTHTGPFLGHAATGSRIHVRGVQIAKVADGKIVERWGATDVQGILQQIGAAG